MSRVLAFLFSLPFALGGLWALTSMATSVSDYVAMQDWREVPGHVIAGGYETRGGDSDTYKAWGEYVYTVDGVEYRNDRVAIDTMADNIGRFQQELGNDLAAAARSGEAIPVWVNPDNPADAIVERRLRWGLVGFKALFGILFSGVGALILWASFRKERRAEKSLAVAESGEPWLANPDWQGQPLTSDARGSTRAAWFFALFWNLVSAPLPFLLVTEIRDKQNYPALIGLLFPIVGIGLLIWAIRRTREWRRFGAAPLELDPYPGSIGGDVAGRLTVSGLSDPNQVFDLTLTLVVSSQAGKSRTERALWQDSQRGQARLGAGASQVEFLFDVPADLAAADTERDGGSYNIWRLAVTADCDGADFDRSYDLPVYPTSTRSTTQSQRSRDDEPPVVSQDDQRQVESLFHRVQTGAYPSFIFAMGRSIGMAAMGTVFGAVFAGAGVALYLFAESVVMAAMFFIIGMVVLLSSIYMATNSLTVWRDGSHVHARRRWLGIPIGQSTIDLLRAAHFRLVTSMQSRSGTRHTIYYSLELVDDSGNHLRLAEGLRGQNEARAMQELLRRELSLADLPVLNPGTAGRPR